MSPLPVAEPRAWLTDPVESGSSAGFGVYLHVPFCHHRCGYCDFATAAVGDRAPGDVDGLYDRYVSALTTDLARQVAAGRRAHAPTSARDGLDERWPGVSSVFVGGGTPTLLGGDRLTEVMDAVRRELDLAPGAEVTAGQRCPTCSRADAGACARGPAATCRARSSVRAPT